MGETLNQVGPKMKGVKKIMKVSCLFIILNLDPQNPAQRPYVGINFCSEM